MLSRALGLLLLIVLAVSCALRSDREPSEIYADLIHSDLPLFDASTENVWPHSFFEEDSFGCTSRVAFGDWALSGQDGEVVDWYRFANYGVFHCWALVSYAYQREGLDGVEPKPSFFIRLGTSGDQELWAIQIGAIPGSDYILLSRAINEDRIVEFNVLQTKCPSTSVRDAGTLDILLTRYCAVNSRYDLLLLARNMVQIPPLGTLSKVEGEN